MSFLLPISSISTGKGRRHRQTNENAGAATVTGAERQALLAERKQLKVKVFVSKGNTVTLTVPPVLQRFYLALPPLPAALGCSWPTTLEDCFASLSCSLPTADSRVCLFLSGDTTRTSRITELYAINASCWSLSCKHSYTTCSFLCVSKGFRKS